MASPRKLHPVRWHDRRASASLGLLGLVLGLGGCFQDHVMLGEDDGSVAGSTTDAPDPVGSTGAVPSDGSEDGRVGDASTGLPGSSSGVAADESTGGSEGSTGSTGADDEGESSTGAVHDDSSGEVPVLGVNELGPGDLVVTEVMWNPSCSSDACEWIEIYNATESPVNLLDLYVQDLDHNPANQGRVTADVVVEAGDVAVITRGVSFWPYGFTPDAVYGPNPGLNNDIPEAVVLRNASGIIDETATFFLDTEEGVAWSLSGDLLDAVSNDDDASWCAATAALPTVSTVEHGSPGALNEACPG